MKIWLDTIDLKLIQRGSELGIVYGVTTNPSLLAPSKEVRQTLEKILDLSEGPLAVQVTSSDSSTMIEEAKRIWKFSKRCVVKIPVTPKGIVALSHLRKLKIPLMATAIVELSQALVATQLECTYLAPYFSHMKEPEETLYQMTRFHPKILAASVKTMESLIFCATLGIDSVTIKNDLFKELVEGKAGESFCQKFQKDWDKAQGKSLLEVL